MVSSINQVPSPNHNARPGGGAVDILVIHYTGMTSAEKAVEWLCNPAAKVSAHYLIDEDGLVTQMVAEDRRAWHAGVSSWRGEHDVNGTSIGIELANPGHDYGYRPFPEAQIAVLTDLAQDIVARHRIPTRNVIGHSDIAPARKIDPGELFPWPRLAAAGLGVWPDDADMAAPDGSGNLEAALTTIGYGLADNAQKDVIGAFQRHFRPSVFDGVADDETLARALAVADIVARGASAP